MRVGLDSVVFAYDFDRLTPDGLLYDAGPLGLHATPCAGAAAPTRQLDGSYYFDGGDYFELSGASQARFYANAPTDTYTQIAVVSYLNALVAFNCFTASGGNNYGFNFPRTAGTAQLYTSVGRGTAAGDYITLTGANKPIGLNVMISTVEAAPRILNNGVLYAAAWSAGAHAATVYDSTYTPYIGQRPGAWATTGSLYYLCLLKTAISSADMSELSAMMMNGVKPFCVR